MTTQIPVSTNGHTQAQTDPNQMLSQALQILIQQGQQTQATLQSLAHEMSVMNRQLFDQRPLAGTPAFHPQPVSGYIPTQVASPAVPGVGSSEWQKKIERATCAAISISKTQNLKWKLVFHLNGIVKPAMLKGNQGYQGLIDFVREVWPQIGPDHFSDERYGELDKQYQIERNRTGSGAWHYYDRYETLPFIVEFYDTAPVVKAGRDGNPAQLFTFRYAERVYPCQPLAPAQPAL